MIKLLRFLKPYRSLLVLILVLAIAQSTANLYLPNLMSDIVNNGIARFNTDYIRRTGGIMVLVAMGGTLCTVVGIFFSSQVATNMVKTIRAALFRKVQFFSLHEFDAISTASLITRTTNDTTQIQQFMVMSLSLLITAPITLVVGIIMALRQDVGLSWILVVIMPILIAVVVVAATKAIPLFMAMQAKLDKLNLILDENLTGVRVIRAFNRIKHEEQRFDKANRDVTDIAIQSKPVDRNDDAGDDADDQPLHGGDYLVRQSTRRSRHVADWRDVRLYAVCPADSLLAADGGIVVYYHPAG